MLLFQPNKADTFKKIAFQECENNIKFIRKLENDE